MMNVTCVLNIVVLFMLSIFRAVNALFEGFFFPHCYFMLALRPIPPLSAKSRRPVKNLKENVFFFFFFFFFFLSEPLCPHCFSRQS